jgi:cell division cycle protein 37
MLDRLNAIRDDMASKGHAYFSALVEQLRTNPSTDAPPTGAKDQPTYDGMILSLLLQIWEGAKQKGVQKDDPNLDDVLLEGINDSIARLKKQLEEIKVELETEEKESRKKITSEDIHDAWDSKVYPLVICVTASNVCYSMSHPNLSRRR